MNRDLLTKNQYKYSTAKVLSITNMNNVLNIRAFMECYLLIGW